jgi:hypothetical protein
MKKIELAITFLMTAGLLAAVVVQAESDRQIQLAKAKSRTAAEIKPAPAGVPQTSAFTTSKQGYHMVTDVLDGFGGESESDNYRIPVSSGGQPSAIGASAGATFVIRAGFANTSQVKRGDPNADGMIDLGDAIYTLNYLFKGGPNPCPMEAGDANCTGAVDLGDAIYILNYLFKGGPPPGC